MYIYKYGYIYERELISWETIIRSQFLPKSLESVGNWFDWLHSDSYEKRLAQYNKHEKIPTTFMQETIYFYFVVFVFKVSVLNNSFFSAFDPTRKTLSVYRTAERVAMEIIMIYLNSTNPALWGIFPRVSQFNY